MTTHLDTLEPRTLLAADVAIERTAGTISLITPDDAPANLVIEQIDARTIRVRGAGDTTVGGDVSKRIRIGKDTLRLALSDGSNVQLNAVQLAGGLTVGFEHGAGVGIIDSTLGGLLVRQESAGDVIVSVQHSTVAGSVDMRTVDGSTDLIVVDSTVRGQLHLRDAGEGVANVEVTRTEVLGKRASAVTGSSNDTVLIDSSEFAGKFALLTGAGRDRIHFDRARFGSTSVEDGAGTDSISVRLSYDFNRGQQGWTSGFADWAGTQLEDPVAQHGALPGNVGGNGWTLGATNRSDDLVAYLTRKVGASDGIIGDASYVLDYEVFVASNSRSNAPGVGGAEGESVVFKLGASGDAPSTSGELHRLNIDVGDQFTSGPAASNGGNIANGRDASQYPDENDKVYVKMSRKHTHTFPVKSNADGSMHLFVGTESGYEGRTVMIYRRVDVTLRTTR